MQGEVRVGKIDPAQDAAAFADWFDVWEFTDHERFPGEPSWDTQDVLAMVRPESPGEHRLLLARDGAGQALGAALVFFPRRDNRHSIGLDVRVLPAHRRHGVGTALVDEAAGLALASGRTVINCVFDVPLSRAEVDPSGPFARAVGFTTTQTGHRRQLHLPMDPARLARLRDEVAGAPGAADYRILTFRGPWPAEYIEDQCALERAMSTDQPHGDDQAEEEVWDEARVRQSEDQVSASGLIGLTAAAQHVETGRVVAYSRMAMAERRPTEAWQWATIVLAEHRGHRLGLAVKLANIEHLAAALPTATRVITSNAAVNAPMIAVNDIMGFEIDAVGAFWQKTLNPS